MNFADIVTINNLIKTNWNALNRHKNYEYLKTSIWAILLSLHIVWSILEYWKSQHWHFEMSCLSNEWLKSQ